MRRYLEPFSFWKPVGDLYLRYTLSVMSLCVLFDRRALVPWHMYTVPSTSGVTLKVNCMVDSLPPWSPGLVKLFMPSVTGTPWCHQLIFTAGLLDVASHVSVACTPGFRCTGSCLMFRWSARTIKIGYVHEN